MDVHCNVTLENYNNIMRSINYHQIQLSNLQYDMFQMLPEVNRCKRDQSCRAGGARHKRITKRVKSNYRNRIKSRCNHSCRKQRR